MNQAVSGLHAVRVTTQVQGRRYRYAWPYVPPYPLENNRMGITEIPAAAGMQRSTWIV
ncbi:hypothetical protein [Lamprobacter modestohalophilus]|uniref:hypothetical protein n=1 Tax=Lamprobacter modestohalophilus TaxID=1064514 RepID=UPI001A937076|nr:hypothetical protein [Lamprobacter modestohalophilus]